MRVLTELSLGCVPHAQPRSTAPTCIAIAMYSACRSCDSPSLSHAALISALPSFTE